MTEHMTSDERALINPESAAFKNLEAIRDFTTVTREMVNELKRQVEALSNLIATNDQRIAALQQQVGSALQQSMSAKSAVSALVDDDGNIR